MKLEFAEPITPKFIKVTNLEHNMIPLHELSNEELEEFIKLWSGTLRRKYLEKHKKS